MGDSGEQGFLSKILNGIVGKTSEEKPASIRREDETRKTYDNGFDGPAQTSRLPQFASYENSSHQMAAPWNESSKAGQLSAEIDRLRQDTDEIKRERIREKRQLELALKIIQEKDTQINRLQEQIKRSREIQPAAQKRGKTCDGSVYIVSSPNVYERSDVVMGYLKRFASPASFLAPPTPKPRSNLLAASQSIKRRKEDLKTLNMSGNSNSEATRETVTEVSTFNDNKTTDVVVESDKPIGSFFGAAESTAAFGTTEEISDNPTETFVGFGTTTTNSDKDKPKETGFSLTSDVEQEKPKESVGFSGFGTTDSAPKESAFSGFEPTKPAEKSAFGGFDTDAEKEKPKDSGFGAFGAFATDSETEKPKEVTGFAGFGTTTTTTTTDDKPAEVSGFAGFGTDAESKPTTGFAGFGAPAESAEVKKPESSGFDAFAALSSKEPEKIVKEKVKRKQTDDDDEEDKPVAAPFLGFGAAVPEGQSAFSFKNNDKPLNDVPPISSFGDIAKDKPVVTPSEGFGFVKAQEKDTVEKPATPKPAEAAPALAPLGGFKAFGAPSAAPVEIDFEDGFASNAGSVSDDDEKKPAEASVFSGFSFGALGSKTEESKPSMEAASSSAATSFGAFGTDFKSQPSPFGSAFGAFGGSSSDATEPKTDNSKLFGGFGTPATESKPADGEAKPLLGLSFPAAEDKKENKPFGGFGGFGTPAAAAPAPAAVEEQKEEPKAAPAFSGAFGAFSSEAKPATPFANAFATTGSDTAAATPFGAFSAPAAAADTQTVAFGGTPGAFAPPPIPPASGSAFTMPAAQVNTPPAPFSFGMLL